MTFVPGDNSEKCGGGVRCGDCVLVKSGGEHQCYGCCWYTTHRRDEQDEDEIEEIDDLP